MTWIEGLIIAAIAALIFVLGASFVDRVGNAEKFEKACAAMGGETVHDGRQYQCFKR